MIELRQTTTTIFMSIAQLSFARGKRVIIMGLDQIREFESIFTLG